MTDTKYPSGPFSTEELQEIAEAGVVLGGITPQRLAATFLALRKELDAIRRGDAPETVAAVSSPVTVKSIRVPLRGGWRPPEWEPPEYPLGNRS